MASVVFGGITIDLAAHGDAFYIQFARAITFNTESGSRTQQQRDICWRLSPIGSPPPSSLALGVGILIAGYLGKIAEDNEQDLIVQVERFLVDIEFECCGCEQHGCDYNAADVACALQARAQRPPPPAAPDDGDDDSNPEMGGEEDDAEDGDEDKSDY